MSSRTGGGSAITKVVVVTIFLMVGLPIVIDTFTAFMAKAWPYILMAVIIVGGGILLARFWRSSGDR